VIEVSDRPIRTLIVDDEPLARRSLQLLLAGDPLIEVAGECKNGREALARLSGDSFELVLLDVQMPGMDGFELLARLPAARLPAVVFVTAHDRHALRAFEVAAVDYLLKPFNNARFGRAIARAKDAIRLGHARQLTQRLLTTLGAMAAAGPGTQDGHVDGSLDRLVVKDSGRVVVVPACDIDWIEAEDYYAGIHVGGRVHLVREPLRDLAQRLAPRQFVRVHRSALVNVARIKELRPLPRGESEIVLGDGTRLRLSRGRRRSVLAMLEGAAALDGELRR
jgi:two-component system LytT family response regulator